MGKLDAGRVPIDLSTLSPDDLKHVAAYLRGRFERAVELGNGQLVSVAGWLSASLFAVNGGGALALINVTDKVQQPGAPGILFGSGLLFALLSGVVIQTLLNRIGAPIEDMMRLLSLAEARGVIDGPAFDGAKQRFSDIQRWQWVAPVSGWVSGILFILGAITLGLQLPGSDAHQVRTCRMLQRGMLGNGAQAERSRLIFETIHCRFQP